MRGKAGKLAKEAVDALYQRMRPVKPILAIAGDIAAGGNAVGSAAVALGDIAADRLSARRPVEAK